MSSYTAIRVEGLGKQYRIGARQAMGAFGTFYNLREVIFDSARNAVKKAGALFRAHNGAAEDEETTIWALKDVLFDVPAGQVVGVIGRNGAGKSTLLKILSRITEPTTGHAEIRGRVGSLLEVGTGFHPELTGRENLFLSGAILGMKRVEIERKFAEIVEFAEVEKFIDTPVKHYSSGMFLRLAFAVAAHLEPEILVVDEVLAVGDAAFQKKCMGKMDEVAGHGRTVLFVSHNMAAVNQLCDRCLLLHDGAVVFDGETAEGIDRYLKMANRGMGHAVLDAALAGKRPAAGKGQIVKVEIHDAEGTTSTFFGIGEPFTVRLHAKFYERVAQVSLGLQFESPTGMPLLNLRTDSQGVDFGPYDAGSTVVFSIRVPGLPFYPGVYKFEPWFAERNGKRIDQIHDGLAVTIEGKGRFESEKMIQPGRGLVMMDCAWSDEKLS